MLCLRTLQQDVPTVGVEPVTAELRVDSISSSTCPVSCLQEGRSLLGDGVFLSASKITWMMNLVPFVDTSIDRSLVHHQSLYTHILTYGAL